MTKLTQLNTSKQCPIQASVLTNKKVTMKVTHPTSWTWIIVTTLTDKGFPKRIHIWETFNLIENHNYNADTTEVSKTHSTQGINGKGTKDTYSNRSTPSTTFQPTNHHPNYQSQEHSRKSALEQTLDYYKKNKYFQGAKDEDWRRYLSQFESFCDEYEIKYTVKFSHFPTNWNQQAKHTISTESWKRGKYGNIWYNNLIILSTVM